MRGTASSSVPTFLSVVLSLQHLGCGMTIGTLEDDKFEGTIDTGAEPEFWYGPDTSSWDGVAHGQHSALCTGFGVSPSDRISHDSEEESCSMLCFFGETASGGAVPLMSLSYLSNVFYSQPNVDYHPQWGQLEHSSDPSLGRPHHMAGPLRRPGATGWRRRAAAE